MIEALRPRAGLCVTGAFAAVLAAFAAHADDTVPAPGTREAVDQAILEQESNRSGALVGMAAGGLVILGGVIDSVVTVSSNNFYNNPANYIGAPPKHRDVWIGYGIGLAAGVPILGVSAFVYAHAQSKLKVLKRERLSLSYSPETHKPVVLLTYSY